MPDGEQHGGCEAQPAAPHGPQPGEDLHAGRHPDQETVRRKDHQSHSGDSRGKHMMRPDGKGEHTDHHTGQDNYFVAEQTLPRKDRDNFGHDPKGRQDQNVNLRMPEEPE